MSRNAPPIVGGALVPGDLDIGGASDLSASKNRPSKVKQLARKPKGSKIDLEDVTLEKRVEFARAAKATPKGAKATPKGAKATPKGAKATPSKRANVNVSSDAKVTPSKRANVNVSSDVKVTPSKRANGNLSRNAKVTPSKGAKVTPRVAKASQDGYKFEPRLVFHMKERDITKGCDDSSGSSSRVKNVREYIEYLYRHELDMNRINMYNGIHKVISSLCRRAVAKICQETVLRAVEKYNKEDKGSSSINVVYDDVIKVMESMGVPKVQQAAHSIAIATGMIKPGNEFDQHLSEQFKNNIKGDIPHDESIYILRHYYTYDEVTDTKKSALINKHFGRDTVDQIVKKVMAINKTIHNINDNTDAEELKRQLTHPEGLLYVICKNNIKPDINISQRKDLDRSKFSVDKIARIFSTNAYLVRMRYPMNHMGGITGWVDQSMKRFACVAANINPDGEKKVKIIKGMAGAMIVLGIHNLVRDIAVGLFNGVDHQNSNTITFKVTYQTLKFMIQTDLELQFLLGLNARDLSNAVFFDKEIGSKTIQSLESNLSILRKYGSYLGKTRNKITPRHGNHDITPRSSKKTENKVNTPGKQKGWVE